MVELIKPKIYGLLANSRGSARVYVVYRVK